MEIEISKYRNDGVTKYEKKPESIAFTSHYLPLCYYVHYGAVEHLEYSNKVILPMRILERLSKYENITTPYFFELITENGSVICGVHEFVIGIDHIYVPHSIIDQIQPKDKSSTNENPNENPNHLSTTMVAIHYIDTPFEKGTKITIQPHKSSFLTIENPKDYLESYLTNYTLLKKTSTIVLPHPIYVDTIYFNIVDTQPKDIICTIDTDLEVDFRAPLDYVEPVKKNPSKKKKSNDKDNDKNPDKKTTGYVAYSGKGRRLGET